MYICTQVRKIELSKKMTAHTEDGTSTGERMISTGWDMLHSTVEAKNTI